LRADNGGVVAEAGDLSLQLPGHALPSGAEPFVGRDVILGIRPEHLEDAALATRNGRPTLTAPVTLAEPVGAEIIVHCEVETPPVVTPDTVELARDVDDGEVLPERGRTTLTARLDPHTRASAGGNVALAVDPEALYFFDPETELALM
jgi:multiple sugar transport system ATP-binding protein